ncbi:hypothetical protein DAPPUDRAFT_112963 [Daphnia pulex]|uniref:Uncharacterized protein n=1 Tax=Daphnia pulex TaxID=6669 RepID=E9HDL1_DAPPU|nr:hypothetical protein DAPPUDRAFT_112963 [Daphnia pulex]|eukprot:EFX70163.1 hypothetical protein DAPPUDRAFT_112963 [Daphnia pulex]
MDSQPSTSTLATHRKRRNLPAAQYVESSSSSKQKTSRKCREDTSVVENLIYLVFDQIEFYMMKCLRLQRILQRKANGTANLNLGLQLLNQAVMRIANLVHQENQMTQKMRLERQKSRKWKKNDQDDDQRDGSGEEQRVDSSVGTAKENDETINWFDPLATAVLVPDDVEAEIVCTISETELTEWERLLQARNAEWNGLASASASASAMDELGLKFPLRTPEDVITLNTELEKGNTAVKHQMQNAQSLFGGKDLKEIVKTILRGLMDKKLRMRYVALKSTRGKLVLKKHVTLFKFVVDLIRRCCAMEKLNAPTEKEILQCLGLTFTYSADEDGGLVIRKQLAALKEAILKKHMPKNKQANANNSGSSAESDENGDK